MGDNNLLPKGGFLRGVLAGLILIFFLFIGLSAYFPLPVEVGPTPTPVTELESASLQPAVEVEESSGEISVPTKEPALNVSTEVPVAINDTAPEVAVAPAMATLVESVSVVEPVSSFSDIQIGSEERAPFVAPAPLAPEITSNVEIDEPTVEIEIQIPEVTSELVDTSMTSDVTVVSELALPEIPAIDAEETAGNTEAVIAPAATLELSGQTLIDQTETVEEVTEPTVQTGAFEMHSAEFADVTTLPLLSVILLVSSASEAQTVASIPAPLTLAVASDNPEALEIITTYRELGGEVVLLLPVENADPTDVPAHLETLFANSNGVIGVLDGPEGEINKDARVLGRVMAKLTETGHAVITVDGLGLNRATVMANDSSVPTTGISHVIDTSSGTIAVVRELDKVVLQTGDQRSITVYGLATPDMLFGLNFWLESQKAQVVTVAPLSASIRRN